MARLSEQMFSIPSTHHLHGDVGVTRILRNIANHFFSVQTVSQSLTTAGVRTTAKKNSLYLRGNSTLMFSYPQGVVSMVVTG